MAAGMVVWVVTVAVTVDTVVWVVPAVWAEAITTVVEVISTVVEVISTVAMAAEAWGGSA